MFAEVEANATNVAMNTVTFAVATTTTAAITVTIVATIKMMTAIVRAAGYEVDCFSKGSLEFTLFLVMGLA